MPVYGYRAYDQGGKSIQGVIEAESSRAARVKLRTSGLLPAKLQEGTFAESQESGVSISLWGTISQKDVAVFSRQLSTLLAAGFPLVRALEAILGQVSNPHFKRVLARVRDRVNAGGSLADALGEHPRVFPPIFVSMSRAGESTGALDLVLGRLADFTEGQLALRNRVWGALAYPLIMCLVGLVVLTFLLTYVIPTVVRIFAEMKQSLPLPTYVLIQVSSFLRSWWWALFGAGAAAALGVRSHFRTPQGRLFFDRVKMRLPLLGGLVIKIAVARFSRTLEMLLRGGVPLLHAFEIGGAVLNNIVLEEAISRARERIKGGENIAGPLSDCAFFPPLVVQMISAGEKSGHLEDMLHRIAVIYESEVDAAIQGLTRLVEPIIILVMGVVVGTIVLSILLPIFEMNQFIR